MTAIILAGGFGTRLRQTIADIPKPMAPVNGRPFLQYLLEFLIRENVTSVILSVGYKHDIIQKQFKSNYRNLEITYCVEKEPLGTGGAIHHALQLSTESSLFVLNGDSYYDISLSQLLDFHNNKKSDFTIALKELKDFDRYGTVKIDQTGRVVQFEEKKKIDVGFVNSGVYCVNKNIFSTKKWPETFSIEKDFLQTNSEMNLYGMTLNGYFIDIGLPEDYRKAQSDFATLFHGL